MMKDDILTSEPTIIVAMSYSVFRPKSRSWRLSKNNEIEKYKADLFSDSRLSDRANLLRNLSLRSLSGQSDLKGLTLVVYVSPDLPKPHRAELNTIVADMDWVQIVEVPEWGFWDRTTIVREILQNKKSTIVREILRNKKSGLYAHTWLDDDDAVSADFIARLKPYIQPENIGKAVSFGSGIGGAYSPELRRFESFHRLYLPKASAGFTVIGNYDVKTDQFATEFPLATSARNHMKADLQFPVILDSRGPSFIRSFHSGQDVAGDYPNRYNTLGQPVSASEVAQSFSISSDIMPVQDAGEVHEPSGTKRVETRDEGLMA